MLDLCIMIKLLLNTTIILLSIFLFISDSYADDKFLQDKKVLQFIDAFSKKHKINKKRLINYFKEAKFQQSSIDLMNRQVESLDWQTYKEKVLSKEKTIDGVAFYKKYRKTLRNAQKRYGVPTYIIVAIIGIETNYGKIQMRYRAFDALATLAFFYPRRGEYFKKELEALILYSLKTKTNPFSFKSSFAGAIGIPQFMPSNISKYGVDGNGDKKVDIVNNMSDAIYSVGNYLRKHGWKKGEPVAVKVRVKNNRYKNILKVSPCSQKKSNVKTLRKYGVAFPLWFNSKLVASLYQVDIKNGKREFHVIFNNFCTIGKYNNSAKYILAVNYLGNRVGYRVGAVRR